MAYTVSYYPPQCIEHAQEVQVTYKGLDRGVHQFNVTSLSQPGREWFVDISLSKRFNSYPKGSLDPKKMFDLQLYRIYSTDPGWLWNSCNYLQTLNSTAMFPSFIPPKVHDYAYRMLHSELAVMQLLCKLGPGVLKTNQKFHAQWNTELECFDIAEFQNP